MKNTVHVEYEQNGKTYFMVVNRYSDIPKGVRIVYVKVVKG